jgi:hypothetical protein
MIALKERSTGTGFGGGYKNPLAKSVLPKRVRTFYDECFLFEKAGHLLQAVKRSPLKYSPGAACQAIFWIFTNYFPRTSAVCPAPAARIFTGPIDNSRRRLYLLVPDFC